MFFLFPTKKRFLVLESSLLRFRRNKKKSSALLQNLGHFYSCHSLSQQLFFGHIVTLFQKGVLEGIFEKGNILGTSRRSIRKN